MHTTYSDSLAPHLPCRNCSAEGHQSPPILDIFWRLWLPSVPLSISGDDPRSLRIPHLGQLLYRQPSPSQLMTTRPLVLFKPTAWDQCWFLSHVHSLSRYCCSAFTIYTEFNDFPPCSPLFFPRDYPGSFLTSLPASILAPTIYSLHSGQNDPFKLCTGSLLGSKLSRSSHCTQREGQVLKGLIAF